MNERVSDFSRRFTSYTIIIGVILILMYFSNLAADEFTGKNTDWKRTFHAGDVSITMDMENTDNYQDGIFRFTDILKHNFTMTNNYNERIVVSYTQYNFLGMKQVSNATKEFELDKGSKFDFSTLIALDNIGNNHVQHWFVIKNYSNPDQILAFGQNVDNVVVFSQDAFVTAFIQSTVLRFAWALAVPLVIISTKHLVDIWYGK